MIKYFEWAVVILVASVLIMACTTVPHIDDDVTVEKSYVTCHCHADSHRRSSGMYDLARETRKKVDEAMRGREAGK
jgi:hypothetical protein